MKPRRLASDTSFSMTSGCAETLAMTGPMEPKGVELHGGGTNNLRLVASDRLYRVEAGRLHGRIQRRQRGDQHARNDRRHDVERRGRDRQVIDRVDLRVELDQLVLAHHEGRGD